MLDRPTCVFVLIQKRRIVWHHACNCTPRATRATQRTGETGQQLMGRGAMGKAQARRETRRATAGHAFHLAAPVIPLAVSSASPSPGSPQLPSASLDALDLNALR